ncbi:hypothetical protein L7F22_006430 [Adiantum nelumboides]|nr:hypothetical protein [Adiantum nelumboides]
MKQYCKGNFGAWDPMITTPPGLYFTTYIYWLFLRLGEAASIWSDSCSPTVLRHVNVIFSIISAVLFREITLQLEPDSGPTVASLKALALSCYPLHWFFTFLFYTDVGSTTAVLAMYLACLKRAYWTSALLSLVAILFRQTNVVWTFFVMGVCILDFLFKPSSAATPPLIVDKLSGKGAIRESSKHGDSVSSQDYKSKTGGKGPEAAKGLMEEILFILQQGWQKQFALVGQFLPFTLPIICFLVFVAYNGSIVLGAKESHKVSPHFSQVV